VEREELQELVYLTPIANLVSICELGILSHLAASSLDHDSIALPEVQALRSGLLVPGGGDLHSYVNLYICARNPMMYKRRANHTNICVLRVDAAVIDLPGVVITDGNAASRSYTRFASGASGLKIVDRKLTFADNWTHSDQIEYYKRKRAKCAEVLVPDRVGPENLAGVYVSCGESEQRVTELGTGLSVTINPHLFFR
jgi:hypothetical protein